MWRMDKVSGWLITYRDLPGGTPHRAGREIDGPEEGNNAPTTGFVCRQTCLSTVGQCSCATFRPGSTGQTADWGIYVVA